MGDKDFFLSPDDAMTMGDIDYMRKAKRVKRTFPKTVSNKAGFAIETEVSAMEDRSGMFNSNGNGNASNNGATFASYTPTSQPTSTSETVAESAPAPASSSEDRRKTDTSMDMFRNMAKNIRR